MGTWLVVVGRIKMLQSRGHRGQRLDFLECRINSTVNYLQEDMTLHTYVIHYNEFKFWEWLVGLFMWGYLNAVLCFFFFFHRVSEIAKEMKPNVQIAARLRSQEQEAMTYPLLQGCKLEVIGKQILPHHVAGLGWLIFWTQLQTWCVHVDGEQRSQSADNIAKPNKRC